MDHFGKTVTVQNPPEFRRFTQATVLPGILVNLGKEAVHSVQFLPWGSFRASFSSPEHKVRIESKGRFNIGSHECVVQATGPPQVDVYVHYYPFEAPDADIRSVVSKFGQIKGLRYQSFPGYSNVKTGSRIVRMVVEREIPSQQSIRGYPCRVWYKGQPIRCNICREVGHLAASCPNKGLCRWCKEPGHTAGQCTKAWNTAQVAVPAVAGPSSSGVSQAALAPRPQRGAVCERAPTASVPDPFEETKMLLAEAMDTESEERRSRMISAISRDDLTDTILENDRVCEKHFVSGRAAKPWDKFNVDWVPTLNLGHNKKTSVKDREKAAKRCERARKRELKKKPAFAKRKKELESEREAKRSKLTEPGQQILDVNFEVSNGETLAMSTATEKGTQTDGKVVVDTGTQSEEFDYLLSPRNTKPPFDQWEFENDREKVKFYTGLPSFHILNTVFLQVSAHVTRKSRNLTTFQEFIMTLMKLELDMPFKDLSYRFDVSLPTVSRIFTA